MRGVFESSIGKSAFIDRVDLSLTKPVSLENLTHFRIIGQKPCLGKDSFYARHVWGESSLTGNRFYLWYGKASRFPRVPVARLTLLSDCTPLTAAEVLTAVRELVGDITAVRVTRVELTFDLHHDQAALAKSVFSIAQKRTELIDSRGWRTTYIGGPDSEREICIYQKTSDVVRVELVLRRRSLVRLGIVSPEQILFLRLVDFDRFMFFRDLDTVRFQREVDKRVAPLWRRRIWQEYMVRLSVQERTKGFEQGYDVGWATFTRPAPINRSIKGMQRRLIF